MDVGEVKVKKPHTEQGPHKVVRTSSHAGNVTTHCKCGAIVVRRFRKAK